MQQFGHSLVNLINQARTEPREASKRLEQELSAHYQGDELNHFNKRIETFQGKAALEDYTRYMSQVAPASYLTISPALTRAAETIARQKGDAGRADHEAPRVIHARIEVNGRVEGRIGQLIALRAHSPEEVAAYFLLDDGLATRKRRRMLLDPQYRFVGIGTSRHRKEQTITVILLGEDVREGALSNLGALSSNVGPQVLGNSADGPNSAEY